MSHEIRTPLNGVIGFTDLLLSTELSENQKQFAVNANVSGKALLGIISDILDFSKIEAGKMELDIVNSSISEIMEEAVDIIKFSACKKGLDVILNIPVDLPDKAKVDPLRLKQILLNLLNNAVKFTQKGQIELSAKFTPQNENSGRFIFSIKDTGIGISQHASQRLFQAFSQADGSITRKYGGTGLGLVISNYFASQMGAHIDFISEEGKGSEFYFAIDTDYIEKAHVRRDKFKGKRVLLADLNESFLEVKRQRLEYWGLDLVVSSSIEGVISSIAKTYFDVIIIDERLVGVDDFKKINKELTRTDPTGKSQIIVTYCPNDNVELVNISKGINADRLMTKPLMINELYNCLLSVCIPAITSSKQKTAKHEINKVISEEQVKVLIAEDVEMNMVLIQTLVKKFIPNVKIYKAKNGMEAVQKYKDNSPHLILMDIQMPELDGIGATQAIKKMELNKSKNTPIVALTAGAFSEDKENCLQAGMVGFLTKPISVKELNEVLKKYLGE